MADDQPKDRDDAARKQRGAPADSTEPLEANEVDSSSWSNLWQVPAIVLSVGLILLVKQLPDDAFSHPDALLDRETWERWLENIPLRKPELSAAGS